MFTKTRITFECCSAVDNSDSPIQISVIRQQVHLYCFKNNDYFRLLAKAEWLAKPEQLMSGVLQLQCFTVRDNRVVVNREMHWSTFRKWLVRFIYGFLFQN